jgi:cysteinyl-tRNA synthetase
LPITLVERLEGFEGMSATLDHMTRFKRRALMAAVLFVGLTTLALLLASVGTPIEPGPAAAVHGRPSDPEAAGRRDRMMLVKSWRDVRSVEDIQSVAAERASMIVIDPRLLSRLSASEHGRQMERFRGGSDSDDRLLVAHLSIGSIESDRPYWGAAWVAMGTSAAVRQTAAAPFWDQAWHDQLYGRPDALLDRLIAGGYDGVYLADAENHRIATDVANAAHKMADLVTRMADYARRQNPYFMVVLGSAEELLAQPAVRARIDAVAKSGLLYGVNGPGIANDQVDVASSLLALRPAIQSGHPIFVSERVTTVDDSAAAKRRLVELGFVGDVRAETAATTKRTWSKVKF